MSLLSTGTAPPYHPLPSPHSTCKTLIFGWIHFTINFIYMYQVRDKFMWTKAVSLKHSQIITFTYPAEGFLVHCLYTHSYHSPLACISPQGSQYQDWSTWVHVGPDHSPRPLRQESSPQCGGHIWRTGRGLPSLLPLSCSSPEAIAREAPPTWTRHMS